MMSVRVKIAPRDFADVTVCERVSTDEERVCICPGCCVGGSEIIARFGGGREARGVKALRRWLPKLLHGKYDLASSTQLVNTYIPTSLDFVASSLSLIYISPQLYLPLSLLFLSGRLFLYLGV